MHKLETDEREAQNIQQVDVSAMKHVKTGNPLFGWTANDWPLEVPPDNLSPAPYGVVDKYFVCEVPPDNLSPAPSTGLSINILSWSGGRTCPYQKFQNKETQGIERE